MKAIAISGLPGTGTSTLATHLSERLDTTLVNSGQIFRELAREHGMELLEFSEYVKTHPEIDREIDARQVELARQGGVILEGRLAGWNLYLNKVPSVKILIEADLDIRAERVVWREEKSKEDIAASFRQREAIDAQRYRAVYDIDLFSKEPYDVVIDNGQQSVEETLAEIIAELEARIPKHREQEVSG